MAPGLLPACTQSPGGILWSWERGIVGARSSDDDDTRWLVNNQIACPAWVVPAPPHVRGAAPVTSPSRESSPVEPTGFGRRGFTRRLHFGRSFCFKIWAGDRHGAPAGEFRRLFRKFGVLAAPQGPSLNPFAFVCLRCCYGVRYFGTSTKVCFGWPDIAPR